MLEDVKKALRLTDEDFDNEVAKEDLISSGVASNYFETEKVENKLLKLAIILYCKTFFGFDNPDSEKYNNAYEYIKKKVSITLKGE